jgi:hypothetical protein
MFENSLHAPEAASSKNCRLMAFRSSQGRIDKGSREGSFRSFRISRAEGTKSGPADQADNHN